MIPALVILVMFIVLIGLYSSLIRKKNDIDKIYEGMETMQNKRNALIPNLLDVMKQYINPDKNKLSEVEAIQSKTANRKLDLDEKVKIENKLISAIEDVNQVTMKHPDMASHTGFAQIQGAWNEIEDQLAAIRSNYNATVAIYNQAVTIFPTRFFARLLKFTPRESLDEQNAKIELLASAEV